MSSSSESVYGQMRSVFLGHQASEVFREIPLVASVLYYSLTIFFARLLRTAIRKTLPQPYQNLAADFVMTFAGCACSLENSMIRRAYGFKAYGGILFVIAMWFSLTIHDGSRGNPCGNMISYMKGEIKGFTMLSRMIFQLLGGLVSYRYAKYFWYLELTQGHGEKYAKLHCTTDLTVSSPMGFLLEFSAVFFDALLALTTFTPFFVVEMASKIFIGILMVLAGIHLTGMYMNPVNATNQTFGCDGISIGEHIFVYWGGPLLAAALAVVVHRNLSIIVRTHLKNIRADKDSTVHDKYSNGKINAEKWNSSPASGKLSGNKSKEKNYLPAHSAPSSERRNKPRLRNVRHQTEKS